MVAGPNVFYRRIADDLHIGNMPAPTRLWMACENVVDPAIWLKLGSRKGVVGIPCEAGAVARKRASANKDEGKQALAAMAGGALAGWFDADSFVGSTPNRLVDSRDGTGGLNSRLTPAVELNVPIKGITLSVNGHDQIVPSTAVAAALNVTAVEPAGPGYVTFWPCVVGCCQYLIL